MSCLRAFAFSTAHVFLQLTFILWASLLSVGHEGLPWPMRRRVLLYFSLYSVGHEGLP
jgi:hypothetical protein